MNHQAIKEKLLVLRDGALSVFEVREIQKHLSGCAECRELSNRLEIISKALSRSGTQPSSEDFVQKVMARLEALEVPVPALEPEPWTLPRWLFPAIGYACAFFLMAIAVANRLEPAQLASTDDILLSDVSEDSQGVFLNDSSSLNSLFGVLKEEV